jgi:hypothetical protein
VNGPANASDGDLIYFKLITILKSSVSVVIANDMNDGSSRIVCVLNAGQTVVARHPQKIFISFLSQTPSESGFFFQLYFSKQVVAKDLFVNSKVCDDNG